MAHTSEAVAGSRGYGNTVSAPAVSRVMVGAQREGEIKRAKKIEEMTLDEVDWLKGKGKCSFYIAQYPVRWTAQTALNVLPSLTDLFIPTPTRLLREAF